MHTWTTGKLVFPWQPRDREPIARRQPREPHKTFFLQFYCPSKEENKGLYTHDGICSAHVDRASTMGLNFNKVKCRFVVWLSLNEITLQAEQVSSCCFCTALMMQPRWPRPCSYAHKVNTSSLPQPGDVATSVRPRNSLSNHSQFTTVLQWAWRSVVAPPLGFRFACVGSKAY